MVCKSTIMKVLIRDRTVQSKMCFSGKKNSVSSKEGTRMTWTGNDWSGFRSKFVIGDRTIQSKMRLDM